MGRSNKRRIDKIHFRNVQELCFVCKYVSDKITAQEQVFADELNSRKGLLEQSRYYRNNGDSEKAQECIEKVKEITNRYKGTWFTNSVDHNGSPDPGGKYKKIKVEHFNRYMVEAEEIWARNHKEVPLSTANMRRDLERCGIICGSRAKTHRPFDFFGERLRNEKGESVVANQVMEFSVIQIEFFAASAT